MNDRRLSFGLTGIALATLAGATLLYSGGGPLGGATSGGFGGWNPVLAAIARALTMPIATGGISDVRDVMPLVGLGCAALLIAFTAPRMGRSLWHSYGAASPGLRWLISIAVLILIAGMASAWSNGSMHLSRGWLIRFAAGAGWAWLLGRYLPAGAVRSVAVGMLALGAAACGLALAHRAGLGVRYFSWPSGTLTITAALASVWTAMAGGWLISPRQTASHAAAARASRADAAGHVEARRFAREAVIMGLVLVAGGIAAYVLQQSGRRAALLGCLAGVSLIGAFRLWIGRAVASRGRVVRRGLVIVAGAVALASAAWYVQRERASGQRERAIPVALRFSYLRLCGELIRANPLLGIGPDMTVVDMTNAVAPLRADMPHRYHGTIDAAVHNEWAQAAVELGVPAAILYLALPIGIVVIALRSAASHLRFEISKHDGSAAAFSVKAMVALAAGVVAIVVTEAGSITLRGPMMPPWYWTMLGLLVAAGRSRPATLSASAGDESAPAAASPAQSPAASTSGPKSSAAKAEPVHGSSPGSPSLSSSGKIIGIVAALVCAIVVHREYLAATAESVAYSSREADTDKLNVVARLYSEKTILARFQAAESALARAQAAPRRPSGSAAFPDDHAEYLRQAVLSWSELYEEIPGLAGVMENYARALLLARKPSEARFVLRRAIEEKIDPYSAAVNVLYANLSGTPPLEKYRCVQRALRASALDEDLVTILREVADDPEVIQAIASDFDSAQRLRSKASDQHDFNGVALEAMRIRAFLDWKSGLISNALTFQDWVAQAYQSLEEANDPHRRASAAETDAFEQLAHMCIDMWRSFIPREIPESQPIMNPMRGIDEALRAIRAAERYAVLGLPHDRLAHPQPELGFVFGEVMPTAFPERLRPLWRFSALLHLTAGKDQFIDYRIYFSLPPEQWTPLAMQREMAALAQEAVAELSRLPANLRPKHFAGLQALANGAIPR